MGGSPGMTRSYPRLASSLPVKLSTAIAGASLVISVPVILWPWAHLALGVSVAKRVKRMPRNKHRTTAIIAITIAGTSVALTSTVAVAAAVASAEFRRDFVRRILLIIGSLGNTPQATVKISDCF